MPTLTKRNESIYPRESIYEGSEEDSFDEDSEPRPGIGYRAGAHGIRNAPKYALGGLGVVAGGLAAKQAGRVAGKVRTKADDPQYDTNYRTGQAQFYSRMRDNQRKRNEEDLEEVERLIPAAAVGLGGAHIANKFHAGYRQGQSEKRHSAITKGFDDAWRSTYGKRKEEMVEVQGQDDFEEDSLTEIAGAIRAAASKLKLPKMGTKSKIAIGAGAGLGGVGAYQGGKGLKAFGKKVVEDEGDSDGFSEDDIRENRALYRVSRSVRGKGATGELHREINRLAAADSYHRGIPFSNRSGPGRPRTTYHSKSVPRKFQSRGVRQESDGFDEDEGNSVHMEGCDCPSCKRHMEAELEEKDRYMMRNAPGGVQFAHVRSPALGVFKRKPTYGTLPGKRLVDEEKIQEGVGRATGEGLKWAGRGLAALDIGVLGAQGAKAVVNRNKNKQNEEDDGFDEDELTEVMGFTKYSVGQPNTSERERNIKSFSNSSDPSKRQLAMAMQAQNRVSRKESDDGFDEDELTERFKGQSARTAIEFGAKHSGKVDTALFGAGTVNSARNKGQDLHDDQKLNSSHLRRK